MKGANKMSNNIVNQYSSTIVTIFQDVQKNYEYNLSVIKQTEDELNDLNHEIELSGPKDMYKGYLLYKNIRELRQKRREAKDTVALLEDMYEFLKGPQGQTFKNQIQKIQGGAAKISESQQHRAYTPRCRNDLTIADQRPIAASRPFEELLAEFNETKITQKKGKLRK